MSVLLRGDCLQVQRRLKQGATERFSTLGGNSQHCCKHAGLVAAAKMLWIEAVAAKFFDVNDGALGVGEFHARCNSRVLSPKTYSGTATDSAISFRMDSPISDFFCVET